MKLRMIVGYILGLVGFMLSGMAMAGVPDISGKWQRAELDYLVEKFYIKAQGELKVAVKHCRGDCKVRKIDQHGEFFVINREALDGNEHINPDNKLKDQCARDCSHSLQQMTLIRSMSSSA